MKDLIEALQILLKYANPSFPTHCEHDVLYVLVDPTLVSLQDMARLDELGFFVGADVPEGFTSYKYGSA